MLWKAEVGSSPRSPVIVGDKVLIASLDSHKVMAMDASSGKLLWDYTAGGPIDTPPTIHGGLVLFGCRDGRVYCLRLADGELVWKFLAAPCENMVMVRARLESSWPVNGTVMIHKGAAWIVAGRSSVLDGGLHVYILEPATGEVLKQTRFKTPESDFNRTVRVGNKRASQSVNTTLADILLIDGQDIYMHHMKLDPSAEPCFSSLREKNKVGFDAVTHPIAA